MLRYASLCFPLKNEPPRFFFHDKCRLHSIQGYRLFHVYLALIIRGTVHDFTFQFPAQTWANILIRLQKKKKKTVFLNIVSTFDIYHWQRKEHWGQMDIFANRGSGLWPTKTNEKLRVTAAPQRRCQYNPLWVNLVFNGGGESGSLLNLSMQSTFLIIESVWEHVETRLSGTTCPSDFTEGVEGVGGVEVEGSVL